MTLRFPGVNGEGGRVCVAPLARLTSLQQLVVQGVVPKVLAAAAAAAAANGAGAAAGGGDGVGSGQSYFLPNSLNSLTLEGQGWDDLKGQTAASWLSCIGPGNRLQTLQLINFNCPGPQLFAYARMGHLVGLRELRVLMAPAKGDSRVLFHGSWRTLSALEVLEVGPYGAQDFSQRQIYWGNPDSTTGLLQLTKLKSLGFYFPAFLDYTDLGQQIQLLQLTELCFWMKTGVPPKWVTPVGCPQLRRLIVEARCFSSDAIECYATQSQLTCLRLDGARAHLTAGESLVLWSSFDQLQNCLPRLQRLELFNYVGSEEQVQAGRLHPLKMPDLSVFPQIRQLQLVCMMDPEKEVLSSPAAVSSCRGCQSSPG